jgi:hypothetical protein
VPECFDAFDQAMGRANGVALVEVVRAEILVGGGGPVEHVVAGGKDRIGDRDQRELGTAQRRQAPELRLQISPLAFGSCPGALTQRSPQPGITRARGGATVDNPTERPQIRFFSPSEG